MRVAIAGAGNVGRSIATELLGNGHEVLLIDNPLGGLDPRQSRWWLEFLCSLSKGHELLGGKPVSIAVTTEDLRPWLEFGSRFAVVKQKRWLELGPKEAVENTKDEFVREMLGLYDA